MNNTKYFECHVTIDPVPESELETLSNGVAKFNFKLAKLLMVKNNQETMSDRDAFMTAHAAPDDYDNLCCRMLLLCEWLKENGYKLRRYKIESVVMDSRNHDIYGLFDKEQELLEKTGIAFIGNTLVLTEF